MTAMVNTFMGSVPHDRPFGPTGFGLAVAELLRRRYPVGTAKLVADDLSRASDVEVTVKAAENLLSGHVSEKTVTRLIRAYGLGFMIDASAAVAGQSLEQFIQEKADQARDEQSRWERLGASLDPSSVPGPAGGGDDLRRTPERAL